MPWCVSRGCAEGWERRGPAYPPAGLVDGGPVERLAVVVLGIPHRAGGAIGEADHVVLPVADVVAELVAEDGVALVVGVEVHVEGVDGAVALVVDDDGAGGVGAGAAAGVGLDAVEVGRVFAEVGGGGEVDVGAVGGVGGGVQLVEVGEGEG